MDELINILVFIGTIAVFIFSAIRKNKNTPNKAQENSAVSLESLFGIQTEEAIDAKTEEVDIAVIEKKPAHKKESYTENNIEPESKNAVPDMIKEGEIGDLQPNEDRFDLKSAIVYTEILKRKNF